MRYLLLPLLFLTPAVAVEPMDVAPLMAKYCERCHNDQKSQGELNLAGLGKNPTALTHRKAWLGVRDRVERHEMPPDDAPQPTPAEAALLAKSAAEHVRRIDDAVPAQPGRVTMRRLNREEYRNTIRDLFGLTDDLTWDPTRDFPADGAGYGFDTIGDVLTMSPLHLEKYLIAADEILTRAIVIDGIDGPRTWTFPAERLRIATPTKPNGSMGMWPTNWIAELDVRQPGEYRVKAVLKSDVDNSKQAQMAVQTDGRQPEKFTLTRQGKTVTIERKIRIPETGRKQVWIGYLHEQAKKAFEPADAANGVIRVESIEIIGPIFDAASLPKSHTRLIVARPSLTRSRAEAAGQVLAAFLPRAFRRPVTAEELVKYVRIFEWANVKDASFESAMIAPLKAALVSPHFLYRIEVDRGGPAKEYRLDAFELASRLSYFLWSTMPDDELLRVAGDGSLTQSDVLESQARRLLADPKAIALSENFVSQWLQLRTLDTFQPDPKLGKIGTGLRNGIRREPILIFHEALTQHLPLSVLIDADFTYANEETAKFYRLPLAPEHTEKSKQRDRDRMIRYPLTPEAGRGGLMTTAAVLMATSLPDRTSPVKRGKWVLDVLLGAAPPPPPPAVEALVDTPEAKGKLTLRSRLELHRTAAACASCHRRMDPLGFAFEQFDAIGRPRLKEGNLPIDAKATLPDGTTFDGVPGLKKYLLSEPDAFAKCVTEKLMTYALGRGIEPFDAKAVAEITAAVKADQSRLSRVVLGIVLSSPFRSRSAP